MTPQTKPLNRSQKESKAKTPKGVVSSRLVLPCPFCGQPPEVRSHTFKADYWHSRSCNAAVSCMHKGCHVSPEISVGGYDSEDEALTIITERWNQRQNIVEQKQNSF